MPFTLDEILENHIAIAQQLIKKTPLPAFPKIPSIWILSYYQEDITGYGGVFCKHLIR